MEGQSENEQAARYLAGEMACFANTEGGGAVILGISDDGKRIGTELSPDWLRHRIWELTGRKLTVNVRATEFDDARLLVLTTSEALEPIHYRNKLTWRVDDKCVPVDPTSWHTTAMRRRGVDWSAQPSGHSLTEVDPVATVIARRYLRARPARRAADADTDLRIPSEPAPAGELSLAPATDPLDLAEASDRDLIRRLNLVTGESRLTNAGSLLFVATPHVGVDYIRRDQTGGDSTHRIEGTGPLLVQVDEVVRSADNINRTIHVPRRPDGLVHSRLRAIPAGALREAIVNGVVHRDWLSPRPTVVEHIGDSLTVTSPGGLVGEITFQNIITHPAVPRYRSLASAMSVLGLGEREGIGVDRMVRDMLASGLSPPEFSEVDGPYVRVGLFGGNPDREMIGFLAAIEPPALSGDLNVLMLLDVMCRLGWLDAPTAAPVLQRPIGETGEAIEQLRRARVDRAPVVAAVRGVPPASDPAYRLTKAARSLLARRLRPLTGPEARRGLALDWARARHRASSTEVADLTGVSSTTAGKILTGLAEEGLLVGSRESRRGRGFFYKPVPAV